MAIDNKVQKDPVSEELEKASKEHRAHGNYGGDINLAMEDSFKLGANWKERKMMANAVDGKVIANGMGNPILHLWDKGKHLIDKKVKVIIIKED